MMFHVEDRTYTPEQISVMGSAFERACASLSTWTNGNVDDVRETLARIIFWHFTLGEHDPARLSNLALSTLADIQSPDESAAGVNVIVLGLDSVVDHRGPSDQVRE
jgi:hypothetical protein